MLGVSLCGLRDRRRYESILSCFGDFLDCGGENYNRNSGGTSVVFIPEPSTVTCFQRAMHRLKKPASNRQR